jgi:hypothetical protein
MPEPPISKRMPGPRNLSEARATIARLQSQLGANKPIPTGPGDPYPVPGPTVPPPKAELAELSMRQFDEYLAGCTDADLVKVLGAETAKGHKEQSATVIKKLYAEIRKRRKP